MMHELRYGRVLIERHNPAVPNARTDRVQFLERDARAFCRLFLGDSTAVDRPQEIVEQALSGRRIIEDIPDEHSQISEEELLTAERNAARTIILGGGVIAVRAASQAEQLLDQRTVEAPEGDGSLEAERLKSTTGSWAEPSVLAADGASSAGLVSSARPRATAWRECRSRPSPSQRSVFTTGAPSSAPQQVLQSLGLRSFAPPPR